MGCSFCHIQQVQLNLFDCYDLVFPANYVTRGINPTPCSQLYCRNLSRILVAVLESHFFSFACQPGTSGLKEHAIVSIVLVPRGVGLADVLQ